MQYQATYALPMTSIPTLKVFFIKLSFSEVERNSFFKRAQYSLYIAVTGAFHPFPTAASAVAWVPAAYQLFKEQANHGSQRVTRPASDVSEAMPAEQTQ